MDRPPPSRFVRLGETERPAVAIEIDGETTMALEGDTLLVAILSHKAALRQLEFGGAPRAGFCLMGACQDCWVLTLDGRRLRACTTTVEPSLRIVTHTERTSWLSRG